MSYPEAYARQYDYMSYQNSNPTRPLPADKLHVDLNLLASTTQEIIDFIAGIARSDGALANGIVTLDSLDPVLRASFGGVPEALQAASDYADAAAESAAAAAADAASVAAIYDSFDDRYLGVFAVEPATDNDGNALAEGALYWNSSSGAWVYDGSEWVPFGGSVAGVRILKDASSFTLTIADINTFIVVDTYGSDPGSGGVGADNKDPIVVNFPPAADFPDGGAIAIKKYASRTHPGNVVLRGHTTATTTANMTAGSNVITVASTTGISVGDYASSTALPVTSRVSAINTGTKQVTLLGPDLTTGAAATSNQTGIAVKFGEGIDGAFERQYEIHGEYCEVVKINSTEWAIRGGLRNFRGGIIKGTHSLTDAISPYSINPVTANGTMFMVSASGGPMIINVPHGDTMREGYNPAHFWIQKIAGAYPVHIFAPLTSIDYEGSSVYPVTIYGVGDTLHFWAADVNWLVLDEVAAQQSGINDLSLSSTTSPRTSNQCAASVNLSLVARGKGNRVALPTNGTPPLTRFRLHNLTATLTRDCSVSNSLGSVLATSGWQNVYLFHATDGSLKIVLGVANQGDAELTTLQGCKVNGVNLTGVTAYTARYVGRVTTNASGQVIFIVDETNVPDRMLYDTYANVFAPSQITADQNNYGPTGWESADTIYISADAQRTITGLKAPANTSLGRFSRRCKLYNAGNYPITFAAANTSSSVENRLVAGRDIVLMPNNTIELTYKYNELYWIPTGGTVAGMAAGGVNGSTNDSSSGSGSYQAMTPNVPIPANFITVQRVLRVKAILLFNTATPGAFSYKLTLGGTDICEIPNFTPASSLSNKVFEVNFTIVGLAAPGASANVLTAISGQVNNFTGGTILNNTSQPVALATNGALTLAFQTKWHAAGTGTNTAQLLAFKCKED